MKITIVVEDSDIKITQEEPKMGAIKKKFGKSGGIKKLSVPDKRKKGTRLADEEKEMTKTLKKMGVKPAK